MTLILPIENTGKVSDGYHTFDELYEHRCALFVLLCFSSPHLQVYFKKESDEWSVLFLMLPEGQISYHVPAKHNEALSYFPPPPETLFDGHTSKAVLSRITMAITREANK